MRCDEVLDQLPLLVYDELFAEEAAACRQHLDGCPECRAELAVLGQVRGALDRACTVRCRSTWPPCACASSPARRRDRLWRRMALGITAAAAGLLALASVRLLNIAIEPGRSLSHGPDRNPFKRRPKVVRRQSATHDVSSIATTSPTPEPRSQAISLRSENAPTFSEGVLDGAFLGGFAARRMMSPGQAEALRYAQPRSRKAHPGEPRRTTTTCASNCSRPGTRANHGRRSRCVRIQTPFLRRGRNRCREIN